MPTFKVVAAFAARRGLLTIQQAGERLGLSRSSLYREMNKGRLAYREIADRRFIPATEVDAFVARLERQANEVKRGPTDKPHWTRDYSAWRRAQRQPPHLTPETN